MEEKFYISLAYELRVGDEQELMESTTPENPLVFYSGIGMMLDKFEANVTKLNPGDSFDFTIECADAYGEYDDNGVIDLPKHLFEINGKIEESILFEGNIVPLSDSEGNRVDASVVKVGHDTVTVDLNHPLAGEDLHFTGKIIDKHPATDEEIKKAMSGCHCGGGCHCDEDDCGSGCNGGGCCC